MIDDPRLRFFAVNEGVVTDNVDPLGLYRVRFRIPGLIKESQWARPIMCGGGSPQRGGTIVPKVGSDILVWFVGGDPERPVYSGGWPGLPDAGSEMPANARDLPKEEVPLVQCLQVDDFVITVDERKGQRKLAIEDLSSGDAIVMDREKQGIRIKATSALVLEADGAVAINGLQVTINGRLILPTDKAV